MSPDINDISQDEADYEIIEFTDPGESPDQLETAESGQQDANAPKSFESQVWSLFNTLGELNEALAYLSALPEKREIISDAPKYLKPDQLDFLTQVILSQKINNSFFDVLATKAALEKAVLTVFEAMAEED